MRTLLVVAVAVAAVPIRATIMRVLAKGARGCGDGDGHDALHGGSSPGSCGCGERLLPTFFRFTAARNTQKFRAAQKGPVLSESSAVFGLSVKIFS